MQNVITDCQGGVGCNHIQMIGKDFHAIPSFCDLERRFAKKTFMSRIEMSRSKSLGQQSHSKPRQEEMKIRLLLTVAGLAIYSALPTFAQEQKTVDPKLRQEIEAVEMKFQEAYNNRDVAAIAALYTENAVEVWNRGRTSFGLEAIRKMFANESATNPGKMVNTIDQVIIIRLAATFAKRFDQRRTK